MRKYFLLSVAALMMTTSANAKTDYAEVTAKATIEVAGSLVCDNLNFGTIVVKQGNAPSTVTTDDATNTFTGDIISVSAKEGEKLGYGYCHPSSDPENFGVEITLSDTQVVLKDTDGHTMTADINNGNGSMITGTLNIPGNVTAGTYTGTYTVTYNY
ncbi:MAG: DUF4402 domain-containing protein [Alphaproteobacteria bacterium]|nr:DUF4402 domain-containing protein [Alphaproteobacteria bacterium]